MTDVAALKHSWFPGAEFAKKSPQYVTGEAHPASKLSDQQVIQMRIDKEQEKMTYTQITKKYECSRRTAFMICTYQRRV